MTYVYTDLGGVWDINRLLELEQNELSALAYEYEISGNISVCAFLEYSNFNY